MAKCGRCKKQLNFLNGDIIVESGEQPDGSDVWCFGCAPADLIEGRVFDQPPGTLGHFIRVLSPGAAEGRSMLLAQAVADRIAARFSDALGPEVPVSLVDLDWNGLAQAIGEAIGPEVSAALSRADSLYYSVNHPGTRWPTIEAHHEVEQRVTTLERARRDCLPRSAGEDISNCERRLDSLEGATRELGARPDGGDEMMRLEAALSELNARMTSAPGVAADGVAANLMLISERLETLEGQTARWEHVETREEACERELDLQVELLRDRLAALEGALREDKL